MRPISRRAQNLLLLAAIEEHLMVLIPYTASAPSFPFTPPTTLTKMPKPIPLTTTLRVKCQNIIIHRSRLFMMNLLMKRLSPKTRYSRHIQPPIGGDADTVHYFFSCGKCRFGRETVEHAELVGRAVEAPCVASGSVFLEGKGGERWGCGGEWGHDC